MNVQISSLGYKNNSRR